MCFKCSKEPSHRDGSFEYVLVEKYKNNFQLCTLFSGSELQDAHLNSGTPIFKIRIVAQSVSRYVLKNILSHAKCFHLKGHTHIEHTKVLK